MPTAEVLLQVLLPRKPVAGAAVAVGVRTHQRLLDILFMDFALVSQQTTRVCKSLDLGAARLQALVRSIMLVHMLAGNRRDVSLGKNSGKQQVRSKGRRGGGGCSLTSIHMGGGTRKELADNQDDHNRSDQRCFSVARAFV